MCAGSSSLSTRASASSLSNGGSYGMIIDRVHLGRGLNRRELIKPDGLLSAVANSPTNRRYVSILD